MLYDENILVEKAMPRNGFALELKLTKQDQNDLLPRLNQSALDSVSFRSCPLIFRGRTTTNMDMLIQIKDLLTLCTMTSLFLEAASDLVNMLYMTFCLKMPL